MRDTPSILPLAAENLVFEANGRRLVDGISFDVFRGDRLALIGPNGAGKTLTLQMLHGLVAPTAGAARWATCDAGTGPRKRHAMVFQTPVMLRRSARGNLVHAVRAAGLGRNEARDRAGAAIARFGLDTLAARSARTLSGGEQQRLAIARAAALNPDVLFLDEPTSFLDPGATRQIEEMLCTLHRDGVTLVFSTHDLGQARRLADRIILLHRGRIVEQGRTDAVLGVPKSPEARAFVSGELLW